jgi:glycosyltransferase involved in cell wall biosynthesis
LRILYHFRTRGTGAESVHIAGVARAWEALGHQVVFSSPTGVDPRRTAGANPFSRGRSGWLGWVVRRVPAWIFEILELAYNVVAWWRNRALLKLQDFDFIYERHAFFLGASAWLAKGWGIPLVVEVNELVGDDRVRAQPGLAWLARRVDRLVFSRASLIVVVSPHLKRRIESMGVAPEKVWVLPNGVDEQEYARPADGRELRHSLGLTGLTVIGFVGWFVAWHRLDELVRVFAVLARDRPDLRLLLIGEGDLKPALQDRARELGMDGRVIFTGAVSHAQMPQFIAAMDVGVVPHSNAYRSPIKLFEYMGQGRVVAAPATEPISMVLQDGKNGLLFETGSMEGMQKALQRLVDDPALRARLGHQARVDVLARHTWKANALQVLEGLRPVMGTR